MIKKLSKKKKILFLIITGVLLTSVSVFATYLIESSNVEFENPNNELLDKDGNPVTDVQTAIDVLLDRVGDGGNNGLTINYESQGGSIIESKTLNVVGTLPTPTKEGYYFTGWYDSAEGENKITEDTIITGDTTLYAHWIEGTGSFSTDSWTTIKEVVQAGIAESIYNVGDTKTVSVGTYGNHTVRVANNSNYDCTLESKTACGFVVEFTDIIKTNRMHYNGTTGGWPATEMRSMLNSTILAELPSNLQSVIADTTVVSGYESGKTENYTSTDKLYLLSTKEIYGSAASVDRVVTETRQLDYYTNRNVTTSNYSAAIKKNNGTSSKWWLRSVVSSVPTSFYNVNTDGSYGNGDAGTSGVLSGFGVSPAFRIE